MKSTRGLPALAAGAFLIGACTPPPAADRAADTVYTNGRIYTVNEVQPWAEAVAVEDGKFLVVGSNADVEAVTGETTEVVDLGEATGTVEQVALRTTVLRGIDGTVWHVPNGVVERVGNRSQLWSVAVDPVSRFVERSAVAPYQVRALIDSGEPAEKVDLVLGAMGRRTEDVIAALDEDVDWGAADDAWKGVLCDPQTSGGLLMSVEGSKADALVAALAARGAIWLAIPGGLIAVAALLVVFERHARRGPGHFVQPGSFGLVAGGLATTG